jgi:hypothetical protein
MSHEYWDCVEDAYKEVSVYDGAEVFLGAFRKLPEHVSDLPAAHWTLYEVANGGFLQFFRNSTGVLAPEAARAFERMGLPKVARLVEQAMAYFGQPFPRDRTERRRMHAQQSGHSPEDKDWKPYDHRPFEDIERRFCELAAQDFSNIYDAMDLYAKQNAT